MLQKAKPTTTDRKVIGRVYDDLTVDPLDGVTFPPGARFKRSHHAVYQARKDRGKAEDPNEPIIKWLKGALTHATTVLAAYKHRVLHWKTIVSAYGRGESVDGWEDFGHGEELELFGLLCPHLKFVTEGLESEPHFLGLWGVERVGVESEYREKSDIEVMNNDLCYLHRRALEDIHDE